MAIRKLLQSLEGDPWRTNNPFPSEIITACEVLLNPYARDDERKLAIRGWLAKHQPCVFGQAAAKADRIHIAIVDEALLNEGDDAIRERLSLEKNTWRQWSLEGNGKHGLLVAFLSPKLNYAAPNHALRETAEHLRSLFAANSVGDPAGNDVTAEWLYLKRVDGSGFVKFRVILDFFAAAGDNRWWHDHRFPGGIAFTLNSLGHMVRTKEWYERLANPVEWASRLAMLTISNAFNHPEHGSATHLIDLREGKSQKTMICPFGDPEKLPVPLIGKDWTTYAGNHHTDHSVRMEFFDQRERPDRMRGEYLMDFAYIAGDQNNENVELMNGVPVSEEEIHRDIGTPDSWRYLKPMRFSGEQRPRDEDTRITNALAICRDWLN